eukprot:gene55348-24975_t
MRHCAAAVRAPPPAGPRVAPSSAMGPPLCIHYAKGHCENGRHC